MHSHAWDLNDAHPFNSVTGCHRIYSLQHHDSLGFERKFSSVSKKRNDCGNASFPSLGIKPRGSGSPNTQSPGTTAEVKNWCYTMRGRAYKARRCTVLFILFCIQSGSFLIYYHWPRHRDADVGIGKVLQAYTPGEHKVEKTYLFYDAGRVYHDMNFTCPVPWVRIILMY